MSTTLPGVAVRAACCAAIATLAGASSADAAFQTWTASGPVTTLQEFPVGITGGATSWSLAVTFDTLAPDQQPGDTSLGEYAMSAVFTLGVYTINASGLMQVFDDPGNSTDQFAFAIQGASPPGFNQFDLQLLFSGGASMLSGDGIPSAPLDDNLYSGSLASIGILDDTSMGWQAFGHSTSFVPSPGAGALLALGGLVATRRRR